MESVPLAAKVTADVLAAAGPDLEAEAEIVGLYRVRDQMQQQLLEYSASADAGQENYLDHINNYKSYKNVTKALKKHMEEIKGSFQNKTLALQRMQLAAALRNKVNENDNESRPIMETMKEILTLSKSIIELHQQKHEKEQKLIDIRRKRHSLKRAGRLKVNKINMVMENQKEKQANMEMSKPLKRMQDKLRKETDITTVIQNVFQNIIIGSRTNWAEDSSLKAIVLQLEKNVCFL